MRKALEITLAIALGLAPYITLVVGELQRRDSLAQTGVSPEKRVQLDQITVVDPLFALSLYSPDAKATLFLDDAPLENFRVAWTAITNVGNAPVEKNDYSEHLKLLVTPPWKILSVTTPAVLKSPGSLSFNWHAMPDGSFDAEPQLLNPGDVVHLSVYLSAPKQATPIAEPSVDIIPRIVNMKEFSKPPTSDWDHLFERAPYVFLNRNGIILFLLIAALTELGYLMLMQGAGIFATRVVWRNALIVLTAGLSVSVAEVAATTAVSSNLFDLGPIWVINGAVIAANVICLAVLLWFNWSRRTLAITP